MASDKLLRLILELRDEASKKMQGFGNAVQKNSAQIKKMGRNLTIAGGAITGFAGLAVKAAVEQERQEAQLAATLESTGGAAGMTAKEVTGLASEMQALTGIGDETVLAGQNMLLTFTSIGKEVFPQTTETLLDMATAMNNGAAPSSEQLKAQAIQLGKALNAPKEGITALTRVGVKFTEEQKKMIETMVDAGDIVGAQQVILDELAVEFGGKAAKNMETFGGQMNALSGIAGDFMEQIGFALIPTLQSLVDAIRPVIQKMIDWTKEHPKLTSTIVIVVTALGALMLILGPILMILPGLIAAIGVLGTVFAILTSPITLVILAIAALIAIGWYLVSHWEEVKAFSVAMWEAYKSMAISIFTAVKNFFVNIFNAIKDFIVNTWTNIKEGVSAILNSIKEFFINVWESIKSFIINLLTSILNTYISIWTNIYNAIMGIINSIWEFIQSIWTTISTFITTTMEAIKTTLTNAWNSAKESVMNAVTSLGEAITNFFTNLASQALSWGSNIVQGIIDGLKAKLAAVKKAASDVAKAVMGFMPAHSPSEEGPFRNIITWGENLVEGITQGIQNEIPKMQEALGGGLSRMQTATKTTGNIGSLVRSGGGGKSVVISVTGNTFMGTPTQLADQVQQVIQRRLQGSLKF